MTRKELDKAALWCTVRRMAASAPRTDSDLAKARMDACAREKCSRCVWARRDGSKVLCPFGKCLFE